MADKPIGKLVEEITGQLTEGVSKFTLFVVTKKERGDPIPPNLSNGVDMVGGQCQTVVSLARELAGEYADYPSIEASILSECAGLESSAKNLTSTCRGMTSDDKSHLSSSWQRMVGACGAIAEAVIKLLEILFQAELDRIYQSADRVNTKTDQSLAFSSQQIAGDDYQLFASSVSEAASEATQLAEYLKAKGEGEESPVMRNQLLEYARSITANANSMIESANSCIEQNGDPNILRNFQQFSNEVKNQTKEAIGKIKEAEAFKKQLSSSPSLSPLPPLSHVVNNNNSDIIYIDNNINNNKISDNNNSNNQRGAPSPQPIRPPSSAHSGKSKIGKEWKATSMAQVSSAMKDVAKENEGKGGAMGCSGELAMEIERLAEAAKSGEGAELLTAARNISSITSRFTLSVKQSALSVRQPFYQDKLFQCSASLNDLCRQLKIMASVKASICGSVSHLDRDEQLISLTCNLVRMWQETGHTLDVCPLLK